MKNYLRFLPVVLFTFLIHSAKAQVNNCIDLDGINDYANISSPIPSSSSYTKEAWVYSTSLSGARNIISSSNAPFWLNNNVLSAGQAGSYTNVTDPNAFSVNTWIHVAVTYDAPSQTMRLYRNAKLVATATSVPAYTSETCVIGSHTGVGSFFQGKIDEVRMWTVARTAAQIKSGMYGVATGSTGLVSYYKMNSSIGTTLINSTLGIDGTVFNGALWTSSPIQFATNAFHFDGSNDHVIIPANSNYDISTGTIECWVRPGTLVGNACILGNRGTLGSRWSFHMSATAIGLWNNTSYNSVSFNSTPGTWYHLAFVCNGTNTAVYVNGSFINNTGTIFNTTVTGQPLIIGSTLISAVVGEPFNGDIDEVRIWNTIRTQPEIQTYKDVALLGTEAGLVGHFRFDQGVNGGTNLGLSVVVDETANNNHGLLINIALTGSTSNWVSHSLMTLPVKLTSFTASADGEKVKLQWQTETEQNSREFIIERSADGNNFHSLGSVAANGNSNITQYYSFDDNYPQSGLNYYRLKQVDNDGKFVYSDTRKVNLSVAAKLVWHTVGNGNLDLQLKNGGNERYSLSDMSGRMIRQGRLSNGKVHLSGLTAGTYTASVETNSDKLGCVVIVR